MSALTSTPILRTRRTPPRSGSFTRKTAETISQKLDPRFGRSARRDKVIDQKDRLAFFNAIDMHMQGVRTIFQFIAFAECTVGQLAGLAKRQEAGAQPDGHRTAKDKAARIDTGHFRNLEPVKGGTEFLNRRSESIGIRHQCRHVPEHDSLAWIIGDRSDLRFKVHSKALIVFWRFRIA